MKKPVKKLGKKLFSCEKIRKNLTQNLKRKKGKKIRYLGRYVDGKSQNKKILVLKIKKFRLKILLTQNQVSG